MYCDLQKERVERNEKKVKKKVKKKINKNNVRKKKLKIKL